MKHANHRERVFAELSPIAWAYGEAHDWNVRDMRLAATPELAIRFRCQKPGGAEYAIDVSARHLHQWNSARAAKRIPPPSDEQIEQILLNLADALGSGVIPLEQLQRVAAGVLDRSDTHAIGLATLSAVLDVEIHQGASEGATPQ